MKWRKMAGIAASLAAGAAIDRVAGKYISRVRTMMSIRKLTHAESPYNLYSMHVRYPYSIERMVGRGLGGSQESIDAMLREALPFLPANVKAPDFGCSAFAVSDGKTALMGRNYDFKYNTSAMLVRCAPAGGYRSIAFCALDNLLANDPFESMKRRFACLAAPFVCLDGINEMGVSVAILVLDSSPTRQMTGRPVISPSIAIRLILDRAATTQEAVNLLSGYDMAATNGRDYHFYISDASGDGRVVEYDCDSPKRKMVVTPVRQVTNFFVMHQDKVEPNKRNGIYGHGRERYDAIEAVLSCASPEDDLRALSWRALKAAAQAPDPKDITSNTQWSIVFDNVHATADIVLRRRWDEVHRARITDLF